MELIFINKIKLIWLIDLKINIFKLKEDLFVILNQVVHMYFMKKQKFGLKNNLLIKTNNKINTFWIQCYLNLNKKKENY